VKEGGNYRRGENGVKWEKNERGGTPVKKEVKGDKMDQDKGTRKKLWIETKNNLDLYRT